MLFWIIVFIISLVVLIKGADWFLRSAEKIGFSIGLSPFVVGVVIVGFGTSLLELITSIFAVFKDVTEIVVANAIGSNIANILLIIGFSVVVSGGLVVTKRFVNFDLLLLVIITVLFLGLAWDQQIIIGESIFLLILFGAYVLYMIFYRDDRQEQLTGVLSSRINKGKHITCSNKKGTIPTLKATGKDYLFLVLGVICLMFGANYLIVSVIELAKILSIGVGAISLILVAVGTSLPEFTVSIKAARQNKPEVILGNILGSNVFNLLFVVGIPGLFTTLVLDQSTFIFGFPVMIGTTFLFIIFGLSRKIDFYEGIIFLVLYFLFVGKLFGFL